MSGDVGQSVADLRELADSGTGEIQIPVWRSDLRAVLDALLAKSGTDAGMPLAVFQHDETARLTCVPPEDADHFAQHNPRWSRVNWTPFPSQTAAPATERGTVGELPPLFEGWHFNHTRQCEDDDGAWEIGALGEEGTFSPILKVDTGLYFQPQEAEPLARAILARLADRQQRAHQAQGDGEQALTIVRYLLQAHQFSGSLAACNVRCGLAEIEKLLAPRNQSSQEIAEGGHEQG